MSTYDGNEKIMEVILGKSEASISNINRCPIHKGISIQMNWEHFCETAIQPLDTIVCNWRSNGR